MHVWSCRQSVSRMAFSWKTWNLIFWGSLTVQPFGYTRIHKITAASRPLPTDGTGAAGPLQYLVSMECALDMFEAPC
jgi:hypothetical protein